MLLPGGAVCFRDFIARASLLNSGLPLYATILIGVSRFKHGLDASLSWHHTDGTGKLTSNQ
jgi:hypothetical protein